MEENNNNDKIKVFNKRLVSGIFLVIGLCIVLYFGGNLLYFASFILSLISIIEIHRVFKISKGLLYSSLFLSTLYYAIILQMKDEGILLFLILMLIMLLFFYVITFPKYHIKDISLTIFSILYVCVMFSFVYLLREGTGKYGKYIVWLIFLSSWGCDTFAYCIGVLFGKHKLCPQLSPKKTIEGSIGGIIGSIILCEIYSYLYINLYIDNITISLIRVAFSAALGAIASQIGDLVASAIKRDYNVKDYGDIIPGHGGILDRFDSVIFTAPIFYYILNVYV